MNDPIPFDRLNFFLEHLELDPDSPDGLGAHRAAFQQAGGEFGRHFCQYFLAIERTRLILEQGDNLAQLEKILAQWFHGLFSQNFSQEFLAYLWNSGARHVQLSLDQRFVNMGYAVTRDFCHGVIEKSVPSAEQEQVAKVVDRMLDFCILVATDSFITMTSRCDRSMIEGIAHQVRNPITVIGGNIRRLQKQAEPGSPAQQSYDMVLKENQRLERMVGDIAAYTGLFQDEPLSEPCDLAVLLEEARSWVAARGLLDGVELTMELDPAHSVALGDREELVLLLRYLLENAAEAVEASEPLVRVSSGPGSTPGFMEVAIHNTGRPPSQEDMEQLLSPFHSSKPMGTGLGLPISALAARRNLGALSLRPGPRGGAVCLVELPAPPEN
ncbi:MAG: hypothetical protein K9K66_00450 [Desulfarculaceae bacterium]|nr:hypothetical protein [Desulfarculaceae bacterium]MCF8072181.1 hypothetical protein [Desulfarculaceae bacterium]MCF8100102.1 hypothetical protein [Desulfarculaceae bacterium]MCF8117249.1 hypothetical protein [Desulfarculaceae bacterium]